MEDFRIRGAKPGTSVSWRNGPVEVYYQTLISLANHLSEMPFAKEVSAYLQNRLDTCCNGARGFEIALDGPDSKPVEFWQCIAMLTAKLATVELGKEEPADYLHTAINWDDKSRPNWRRFLEDLYNLINEALPLENKLPPLPPWSFLPKLMLNPPLGADDFYCSECGGIVRHTDEDCPKCGMAWKHRRD